MTRCTKNPITPTTIAPQNAAQNPSTKNGRPSTPAKYPTSMNSSAFTTSPMSPSVSRYNGQPKILMSGFSTAFYIDPVEEITAMFFTQLMPSSTYPIRSQLRVLVNQAVID